MLHRSSSIRWLSDQCNLDTEMGWRSIVVFAASELIENSEGFMGWDVIRIDFIKTIILGLKELL